MKNRKTSYSLSKLHLRKNDLNQSSQQSFKRKHSRKANRSQIQPLGINNPTQNSNYRAVLNEYYGTDQQRLATSDKYDHIFQNHRRKATEKLAHDIEYKMKKLIETHEFDSDINLNNIVLEQSDADQQFQDKIAENKYFLKQQRQKQNFTNSQQKLHTETTTLVEQKKQKKLSILKNPHEKHIRKHKTKSLLPTIGVSSSKILNLADLRYDKHRTKNNQSQRKNLIQQALFPNIYQSPPEYVNNDLYHNQIESKHSLAQKQSYQFKKDDKSSKRKFTEQFMKKSDKKIVQLKLESKIEQLKNKIAQRTSAKESSKSKILDKNVSIPQKKRHSRYSSHSVFDNIQQFLSNPHQKNSKSQRKFLKLCEKIEEGQHIFEKEKQALQLKIQRMETKISTFMFEKKQQLGEPQKLQQFYRPTSTGSSQIRETDSQFGALDWRRLQKEKIEKSSFENELKYVRSLEQKGHNNLMKYIENKKILNQLKMIKKTQEMLSKNVNKDQPQTTNEKYTSL